MNSFTSVSLEPPLVAVCIHERSSVLPDFLRAGRFGLNVLAEDQRRLSTRFSCNRHHSFEELDWSYGRIGVPLLSGVLAALECRLERVVPAGDHHILIGRVSAITTYDGAPLLVFRSQYHLLRPMDSMDEVAETAPESAETIGSRR